jgi:hypothetical protein
MAILFRANLSDTEKVALQKLALDKRLTLAELIADALRKSTVTGKALKDAA